MSDVTNPSLWVHFDKNAYIALSDARLDAIIARERALRIVPVANRYVLYEFFYRLADPQSSAFGRELAGLRRLVKHFIRNGVFVTGPTRAAMLHFVLFGDLSLGDPAATFRHAAQRCCDIPVAEWPEVLWTFLRTRAAHMERDEAGLVSHTKAMLEHALPIVRAGHPTRSLEQTLEDIASPEHHALTRRWVAESVVDTATRTTSRRVTAAMRATLAQRVLDTFPYAIEFEAHFRTKLMRSGFDLAAGENLNDYWDLNLLSTSITHGLMQGNVPAQLVTDEEQLVEMAERGGRQDIARLRTYEAMIGVIAAT